MNTEDDAHISAIQQKIPGYGAYREQENRQADDRLTREFLVRQLGDAKTALDKLSSRAVTAGDLNSPLAWEQVRQRLDHAQTRLSAAVEGYAGWFNERHVDAGLLQQAGNLDADLVALVAQINSAIQQLAETGAASSSELLEAVAFLHTRLDRRHELLKTGA